MSPEQGLVKKGVWGSNSKPCISWCCRCREQRAPASHSAAEPQPNKGTGDVGECSDRAGQIDDCGMAD